MKIGLASDSLGNVEGLASAFKRLAAAGAERLFFLGGRWADVEAALRRGRALPPRHPAAGAELGFLEAVRGELARAAGGEGTGGGEPIRAAAGEGAGAGELERRIVRVASRACPEYRREGTGKVFEMVDGLICCLVHDKSELTRDDIANASVIFHGNSGRAALVAIGPRVFVTPGHLRASDPEGRPPSCALLDVGPAALELVVYSPSGEELGRQSVAGAARSRMSVR